MLDGEHSQMLEKLSNERVDYFLKEVLNSNSLVQLNGSKSLLDNVKGQNIIEHISIYIQYPSERSSDA